MEQLSEQQKEAVKRQLMNLGYEEATGFVYRAKKDPSKNAYQFDFFSDYLEGVDYRFTVKTEQDHAQLESVRAVFSGAITPKYRIWNQEEAPLPDRKTMETQIFYDIQAAKANELLFYFMVPIDKELRKLGFKRDTDRIYIADKTWPTSTFLITPKDHAITESVTGFLIDITMTKPETTLVLITAGDFRLTEKVGQLRYSGPMNPIVFVPTDGRFPTKAEMLETVTKEQALEKARSLSEKISLSSDPQQPKQKI